MENFNKVEETLTQAPAAASSAASEQVAQVADTLENAAEQASSAAKDATNQAEHEVLASVSEALQLLRAELKRANDFREYEQRQASQAVAAASETASQPVAELVNADPPARKVRRGARKVKR